MGKEPGAADIKIPLPNPCLVLRPDNVSIEYAVDNSDRRGFLLVNTHQYNMFGLTLEDFKEGVQVNLMAKLHCQETPFTFKYAGLVNTGGKLRLKTEYH